MKITGKEKTKEKESRSRRKADYLSVYDLFLRSGGCKVGIVIALTLLAEAITLVVLMQGETMYYENLFARGAALPFGIGFLLLTLALIDPLRAQKSNVDYTIRRLHIRPLDVFWVETVYVLLAYFVFWALNVTLLYAFGAYFTSHISTAANREMGILLAFVRTPQLYMLLPIKNVTFWIRNITGVLALSKVYDPRVIRIAACIAILVSFCPKFAALVSAMPTATIGGVSLILYGMISAVGVRNVVENKVDFTNTRNVIIAALILVLAIGISYSGSIQIGIVSLSGLAVASIVGIGLNAILPGKDYVFEQEDEGSTSVDLSGAVNMENK